MKLLYSIFLLVIVLSILPIPTFAHLPGQPPFFKINGTYANFYTVPSTSLSNLDLPQDSPPQLYRVNEPIHFQIDISRLPNATEDTVRNTTFMWDFADGQTAEGLDVTHSFSKFGSYFVMVNAQDPTVPTPQMLESVLIDIVDEKHPQPPKVTITINGQPVTDPTKEIIPVNLLQPIQFGVKSDTKIVNFYQWDFGDQQSSSQQSPTHTYEASITTIPQLITVLRVKTVDGYMIDTFAQIKNDPNTTPQPTKVSSITNEAQDNKNSSIPPLFIIIPIFIGVLLFIIVNRKQ